jgi:hypothetical protein
MKKLLLIIPFFNVDKIMKKLLLIMLFFNVTIANAQEKGNLELSKEYRLCANKMAQDCGAKFIGKAYGCIRRCIDQSKEEKNYNNTTLANCKKQCNYKESKNKKKKMQECFLEKRKSCMPEGLLPGLKPKAVDNKSSSLIKKPYDSKKNKR